MTIGRLWVCVVVILAAWALGLWGAARRRVNRPPSPDAWVPLITASMLLSESVSLVNRRIVNGSLRSRLYGGETWIRRNDIRRVIDARLFDWKQRGRA